MKVFLIKISLLIAFFFWISASQAQHVKNFSEDPLQFSDEIQVLFSGISSPALGIKIRGLLNPFVASWNSNEYNDKERAMVISNANDLLQRRLSPHPDFYNFISIIHGLKKKGNREAIVIWSQVLKDKSAGLNLRQMQAYLEQYADLVNNGVLNRTSSSTWYVSDTSLHLDYDTAIRVLYKRTDLVCTSRRDTSRIFGTSGAFYPEAQFWSGQRGRVTWERVRLPRDSVYADLSSYNINLKLSEYRADSVRLINKKYFREPIFGMFEEKVLTSAPGPGSSYPQFSSYLKNYEIRNLFKNIDYLGGFSVEGSRVIGSGEVNQNASLFISGGGRIKAHIRSNAFRIQGEQITANPSSLSIYTNGDSIYHPGLQMKYFGDRRQLVMFRPESGISQSPFFNGYHAIDMYSGAMYWDIDTDTIQFESVPGISRVSVNEFISGSFFSKYEFYRLQGIDDKNPLYIIRDYSRSYATHEITPNSLAQFMNKAPDQVKSMMLRLSIQGYLYYDLVNDKAIIQDRLGQAIEASVGRRDYDVIKIKSETDNMSNALLDLRNLDLTIRGVEQVFLSDSQQVYIFPEDKEIVLKKGMDFSFSGLVKAGLFDFHAHDCYFEYDSFRLNLPFIDSLVFQVKSFERDERGVAALRKVGSVLEKLSGKILIDHPTNKSGMQPFPSFPVFISEQESFVYYDHMPQYDREKFAYHVYAFVIDSLDNFTTDNLHFDGYLLSAGIFPNIGQPLKVQPDYSLGFLHQVPDEGYPVYGGSGQFYQEINLSNRGLRGDGELTFLTSRTVSDDFLFYPDQMIVQSAHSFVIGQQLAAVEYPGLVAEKTSHRWYPYNDEFRVRTTTSSAQIYDSLVMFTGNLNYSSGGLDGTGKASFENVELMSDYFQLKHHTLEADTLDFRLFAEGSRDLAVTAEQYRTYVDFDLRTVEFRTNQKGSTVSFPYNNFVCFMDNIDWYMDRKEMLLYNDLGMKYGGIDTMGRSELLKLNLSESEFLSTNPLMDSLSFFSVTARYDLTSYVIDAEDVKLIRVADAAIFPDQGDVRILQGGQIQKLANAVILTDTASQYHLIREAEVDIHSKRYFEAKGMYQYAGSGIDIQVFPLTSISVGTEIRTFASGVVSRELNFKLNPYFTYIGNVEIQSGRKDLFLEGGFQTTESCFTDQPKQWVYFKAWVDPAGVRIPVQQPLANLEGGQLDLGVLISDYDEKIYTAWFSPRATAGDTILATVTGEVFFDVDVDGYRIVSVEDARTPGKTNELLLNRRTCIVETSGAVGLGLAFNYVDLSSFGQIRYMAIPDSAVFSMTLAFNFLFSEPALNVMADSVLAANLPGLDITRKMYQDYLEYVMGKGKTGDLISELGLYGNFRRMPDELINTLLLTDVRLYWNDRTNSYVSAGPIGILSIGKNAVNRYVNGTIELIRRRSGDVMTIYLELNPKQWYFFDYRSGIMQALGSDMTFNNRIESVKQERRMQSKPGMDEKYEYMISTRRRLVDFLRRLETSP
ncbi:MAG: hypothetical protein K0B08_03190 [Bacteroidales bacterium]|nr:hypothetical protein [Bacteroidales bacterium]